MVILLLLNQDLRELKDQYRRGENTTSLIPNLTRVFFSLPEREKKEGGLSTSLPVKLELRYDDENTLPLMPRRWRLCSIWT